MLFDHDVRPTLRDTSGSQWGGSFDGDSYISEFTQQDGRKKRTAKRLSVTNVTGILLPCFVGNSLNIVVFSSSTKRSV